MRIYGSTQGLLPYRPSPFAELVGGLGKIGLAYTQGRREGTERARGTVQELQGMLKTNPGLANVPAFQSAYRRAMKRGYGFETGLPERTPLEDIFKELTKGYEQPTVSLGPGGEFRGATFRPKAPAYGKPPWWTEGATEEEIEAYRKSQTKAIPKEYQTDIENAIGAIDRGADRYEVYRRIAAKYPDRSTELQRILLYTAAEDRIEALKQALGLGNR